MIREATTTTVAGYTPPWPSWSISPAVGSLQQLLAEFRYKPGWQFEVNSAGHSGPSVFLVVTVKTQNSYRPGEDFTAVHHMAIPEGPFARREWQRWLLGQILLIEQHEACEFFCVLGERPFAPHHFGSGDPYIIREAS